MPDDFSLNQVDHLFGNVGSMIVEWAEAGYWEDAEGLARVAWQQTVLRTNLQFSIFNNYYP